jgi:hypothetical protein
MLLAASSYRVIDSLHGERPEPGAPCVLYAAENKKVARKVWGMQF